MKQKGMCIMLRGPTMVLCSLIFLTVVLACGGVNRNIARPIPPGYGADSPDNLATRWLVAHETRNADSFAKINFLAAVMPEWAGGGQWQASEGTALGDLLTLEIEDVRVEMPVKADGSLGQGITWMHRSPPPGSYPTLSTISLGQGRLILVGKHRMWKDHPDMPDGRIEVDAGLSVCCAEGRWYVHCDDLTFPEVAQCLGAGSLPTSRPVPQGLTFEEESTLTGKVTWEQANERLTMFGIKYNQPTQCIRPASPKPPRVD